MKTIVLTKEERKKLLDGKTITVKAKLKEPPFPVCTMFHGHGTQHLWDKVDRHWIVGDVMSYVKKMTNKGRRKTDYRNNTVNINSGAHWFECIRDLNHLGKIGDTLQHGRKEPIKIAILDVCIVEVPCQNYKAGALQLKIKLSK